MRAKMISLAMVLVIFSSFALVVRAGDVQRGKVLYDQLCVYCHLTNYDDKFGPGLGGISQRRSDKWLHYFLLNPKKMIKTDEYAKMLKENNEYELTMPALPEMKDKQKRDDIIAYLKTLE